MWPFRRKPSPPHGPDPGQAPEPGAATATAEPEPPRTADDVLRQLEAEAPRTQPIAPVPPEPISPAIGQCLLAEGPVTREFLERQVRLAGRSDSHLGRLLVSTQATSEAQLFALLAAGYEPPEVDLKQCRVHVPTARSIPREIALKYKMVPIERLGDLVCVVFSGALNPKGIEAIRRETGASIKALRCRPHHLQILLRRLYTPRAAAPAGQIVAAVAITRQQYDEAAANPAAKAEARWEALYASKGPIRASRFGRR